MRKRLWLFVSLSLLGLGTSCTESGDGSNGPDMEQEPVQELSEDTADALSEPDIDAIRRDAGLDSDFQSDSDVAGDKENEHERPDMDTGSEETVEGRVEQVETKAERVTENEGAGELECPGEPGYFGGIVVFASEDLLATKKAANLAAAFAVKPEQVPERKPVWSNNECKAYLNEDIKPPDNAEPVDTLDAGDITVKVKDRELVLRRVWNDEHGFFYYQSPLGKENEELFDRGDTIAVDNGTGGADIGHFQGSATAPSKPEPLLPPPFGSFYESLERSRPLKITWKEGGEEKIYVNLLAYTKDDNDKVKDTLGVYCTLPDKGCGFLGSCSYTIPSQAIDLIPDPVDGIYLSLTRAHGDDLSNCWSDSGLAVTWTVVQALAFTEPDGE